MNDEKTNKIMSSEELEDVLPKYEPIKLSGKNLAQNYVSAFNTGMNIYQCINYLQGNIDWTIKTVNDVLKSWNTEVIETTTEQFNTEWTNKQPELIEQVNTLTTNQFNNEKSVFNDELDTLNARMNTFSNPNLLINPDFKINQRGKAEYTSEGTVIYTVDRWRIFSLNVKTDTNGILLSAHSHNDADGGLFVQELENPINSETLFTLKVASISGSISISVVDSASNGNSLNITTSGIYSIGLASRAKKVIIQVANGSSCKIEWVKLEQASIATPFVAPNPTEELVKCKRFSQIIPEIFFIPYASTRAVFSTMGRYYQSTGGLFPVEMRTNPTITYSNIHKANNEVISEKVISVDSNKYAIFTIIINTDVDYYTLRMKNIIADAEIY